MSGILADGRDPAKVERIKRERFAEICEQAQKALDHLWAVSEAIAQRSPAQLNYEMRECRARLDRIIELSNLGGTL